MYRTPDPERRLARIKGRARANSERVVPDKIKAYLSGRSIAAGQDAEPPLRPDGTNDRRRCSRIAVNGEVLMRRLGGFNFNIALTDISTGGCRVEMLEPSAVGDPLVARLPQLEPLGSRVCWSQGTTTGVQFLTKIHPAVFDMLLTRLASGETVEPPAVH